MKSHAGHCCSNHGYGGYRGNNGGYVCMYACNGGYCVLVGIILEFANSSSSFFFAWWPEFTAVEEWVNQHPVSKCSAVGSPHKGDTFL